MYDDIFDKIKMQKLQDLLREHNKTITSAESCTGGLIASMITELSGSSDIFNGAIVSYSNEIKMQELNVKKDNLDNFGAVSIEVVNDMLNGSINKFNADFSIATSGIAGPTGATKNKPVGTVVIGIGSKVHGNHIEIYHFNGDRKSVQIQAAKTSFKKFLLFFEKTLDK
ncbi:damage-inducible protein CinA [Malaciobacter molluscorum]|uniref:CinA family protein n=1 Tax=Malaciobacter molluscorum TaxID=1032072 RepID=UPI00100BDF22|nr:CinA family protein [Malaciobacter molluscorum]RXJ94524.1 damage-inducible protein CinA [Malaciobacter molluscorum]